MKDTLIVLLTVFGGLGTVLLMPLFLPVVVPIAKTLFPRYMTDIPAPMAAVHTFFNIATTLVFLPFVRQFARFVEWLVPAKKKETPRLTVLNPKVRQSPMIALDQASREISFMAESDLSLLGNVRRVIEGTANEREEEHIFKRENILDKVQSEITEFIGVVMMSRLPKESGYDSLTARIPQVESECADRQREHDHDRQVAREDMRRDVPERRDRATCPDNGEGVEGKLSISDLLYHPACFFSGSSCALPMP